jgi:hypothetical protein
MNTTSTTRPTVGQACYIIDGYSGRALPAVVVKVTPAGRVDAVGKHQITNMSTLTTMPGCTPARFGTDRYARGSHASPYHRDRITFDVATVTARLEREAASIKAANALCAVTVTPQVRSTWGKESLEAEVTRLQALLDTASALVVAIPNWDR